MNDKKAALHNVRIFAPHRASKVDLTGGYWGYVASNIKELGHHCQYAVTIIRPADPAIPAAPLDPAAPAAPPGPTV